MCTALEHSLTQPSSSGAGCPPAASAGRPRAPLLVVPGEAQTERDLPPAGLTVETETLTLSRADQDHALYTDPP